MLQQKMEFAFFGQPLYVTFQLLCNVFAKPRKRRATKKILLFGAYTGNIIFSDYLNEHCCLPTYEIYHVLELPVLENCLKCICHLLSWILDPGLQLLRTAQNLSKH